MAPLTLMNRFMTLPLLSSALHRMATGLKLGQARLFVDKILTGAHSESRRYKFDILIFCQAQAFDSKLVETAMGTQKLSDVNDSLPMQGGRLWGRGRAPR